MSRLAQAQETCALLIGSGKYEYREGGADNNQGKQKATKKAGIKQKRTKSGRQIQDGEWATGDIENMKDLMSRYGHECDSHNYIEQNEDCTYALGKAEILQKISDFFKKDKTYFILYYTGHANRDGAWCFPRTKRIDARDSRKLESEAGEPQARPARLQGEESITTQTVVVTIEQEVSTQGDAKSRATVVQDGAEKEKSRTPSPVPKPANTQVEHLPPDQDTVSHASLSSGVSSYSIIQSVNERPDKAKPVNDFLDFHEVIQCWDDNKKSREIYLMIILDCCHSGKWVEKVNELRVKVDKGDERPPAANSEQIRPQKRRDICVQAACRAIEPSMVAENQLSSVFTRSFVAAQSKSSFEKMLLSFFDHGLVMQFISFFTSSGCEFAPISSDCAPFGGIKFFNSFDDMYLSTSCNYR